MNIKDYLDSTYLKTAEQAGISKNKNIKSETIKSKFFIRWFLSANKIILKKNF